MDELKLQLEAWKAAQLAYVEAREAYRKAWATAFAERESVKPEAARKAQCDVATSELRRTRDLLEIDAAASWQAFLVLRGPTDFSRQPGNNFGEAA